MDQFETLKKYKELLDMGIITQDEFDDKKTKILNDDLEKALNLASDKGVKESNPMNAHDCDGIAIESETDGITEDAVDFPGQHKTVTFEREANRQDYKTEKKGSFPKPALIGVVAVLLIVVAFFIFPKNDAKEIQGSWNMVVLTTEGESFYPTGPIGGSLEVKGNKWTMEIHSLTQDSSFSGTVKFDSKETTTEGTEGYFYDFNNQGEGSLKAVYVPKNKLMTISTRSYMDTDNCATFKKNN